MTTVRKFIAPLRAECCFGWTGVCELQLIMLPVIDSSIATIIEFGSGGIVRVYRL